MARIEWDKVDERPYSSGISHGVLWVPHDPFEYPPGLADPVPWNGLTGVEENASAGTTAVYLDGVKYIDIDLTDDFQAKLTAFTYPDELEPFLGGGDVGNGLIAHDQRPRLFHLSYHTQVEDGYQIHLIYNVIAIPEAATYSTQGDKIAPIEFGFTILATPDPMDIFRPTSHIILDSTVLDPGIMEFFDAALYGNEHGDGTFQRAQNMVDFFIMIGAILITDNGDGTFDINAPSDRINMLDDTTFEIIDVDTELLDADTYRISTTTEPTTD